MEINVSPVHISPHTCLQALSPRADSLRLADTYQLFYILIAVLGAFALVSLINYVRTRRRRQIVLAEAERLGLMVPGMEGYVPMRERPALRKLDGWRVPDWWEILGGGSGHDNHPSTDKSKGKSREGEADTDIDAFDKKYEIEMVETAHKDKQEPIADRQVTTTNAANGTLLPPEDDTEYGARGALEVGALEDLRPLALIPVPQLVSEPVKPISPIPYFPNYVSYLKTAHDEKPPRFAPDDPDAFECIVGEPLDVVVAVRMPRPAITRERPANPDDDDDAVMDEWGGLELGVASWQVVSSKG